MSRKSKKTALLNTALTPLSVKEKLGLISLEPRLLLDAAGFVTGAEVAMDAMGQDDAASATAEIFDNTVGTNEWLEQYSSLFGEVTTEDLFTNSMDVAEATGNDEVRDWLQSLSENGIAPTSLTGTLPLNDVLPSMDGVAISSESFSNYSVTESDIIQDIVASINVANAETTLVFVDATVTDFQTLIDELPENVEVIVIEANQDGIEVMAEILSSRDDIDAVHILSHGAAGEFNLGAAIVDQASIIGEYANEFEIIKEALSVDADFLIYGCDFGTDMDAVNALALATGADIAASSDDTGAAALGGNWNLEIKTGDIGVDVFALIGFEGLLAETLDANTLDNVPANSNTVSYTGGDGNVITLTRTDSQNLTSEANLGVGLGRQATDWQVGDSESYTLTFDQALSSIDVTIGFFNNNIDGEEELYDIVARDADGNVIPGAISYTFAGTQLGSSNGNGDSNTVSAISGQGGQGVEVVIQVNSNTPIASLEFSRGTYRLGQTTASGAFGLVLENIEYETFAGQDTDGDGVADINDVDDDNDGILDVDEGLGGTYEGQFSYTLDDFDTDGIIGFSSSVAELDGEEITTGQSADHEDGDRSPLLAEGDVVTYSMNGGTVILAITIESLSEGSEIGIKYRDAGGNPNFELRGTEVDGEDLADSAEERAGLTFQFYHASDAAFGGTTHLGDIAQIIASGSGDPIQATASIRISDIDLDGRTEGVAASLDSLASYTIEGNNGSFTPVVEDGFVTLRGTSVDPDDNVQLNFLNTDIFEIDLLNNSDDRAGFSFNFSQFSFDTPLTTTTGLDSDGDGIEDHLDIDSDNDGITDNIEGQSTAGYIAPNADDTDTYASNDGLNSAYISTDGLTAVDTDGDNLADYVDTNSDNEGGSDTVEAGLTGAPIEGVASDENTDADGDGLFDLFDTQNGTAADDGFDVNESLAAGAVVLPDTDGDVLGGVPLSEDVDFRDAQEDRLDTDGDGVFDADDLDDDNDGILDVNEGFVSVESLGLPTTESTLSFISTNANIVDTRPAFNNVLRIADGNQSNASGLVFNGTLEADVDTVFILGLNVIEGDVIDTFELRASVRALNDLDVRAFDLNIRNNLGELVFSTSIPDTGPTGTAPASVTGFSLTEGFYTVEFIPQTHGANSSSVSRSNLIAAEIAELSFVGVTNTGMSIDALSRDTDGDGIADHLDIDSDNDGITDNIEAQTTDGYIAPTGTVNGFGVDLAYGALEAVDRPTNGFGTIANLFFDHNAPAFPGLLEQNNSDGHVTSGSAISYGAGLAFAESGDATQLTGTDHVSLEAALDAEAYVQFEITTSDNPARILALTSFTTFNPSFTGNVAILLDGEVVSEFTLSNTGANFRDFDLGENILLGNDTTHTLQVVIYGAPNTVVIDSYGFNLAAVETLTPVDTDSDGDTDYLDTDSDNDGLSDNFENGLGLNAIANGTLSENTTDTDGDGLFNQYETAIDGDADDGFVVNEGVDDPLNAANGYLPDTDSDAIQGSIVPLTADLDYRDVPLPPVLDLNSTASSTDSDRGFTSEFVAGNAAVTIVDVDADALNGDRVSDFTFLTITPSSALPDGANEILQIAGIDIPLNADFVQGGVTIPGTSTIVDISYVDGVLTIREASNGFIANADMDALIRSATYRNEAANLDDSIARTFDFQVAQYDPSTFVIDFEELTAGDRATSVEIGSSVYWGGEGQTTMGEDTLNGYVAADGVRTTSLSSPLGLGANADGNFLFHNTFGVAPAGENVVFGRNDIPVEPNTDYTLSLDLGRVNNVAAGPFEIVVNGAVIGTVTSLPVNSFQTFTFTFSSGEVTSADFEIRNLSTNPTGNDFGIDNITFQRDPLVLSNVATATVDLVADVAPVAQDDGFSINENPESGTTEVGVITNGNLFADNGNGIDSDVNGDTLSITQINGVDISNGEQITLASGALLTIRTDGTFDYDPNGAFDSLDTGETGTETFTYTLSDGTSEDTDSATVTITINGDNDVPIIDLNGPNNAGVDFQDVFVEDQPGQPLANLLSFDAVVQDDEDNIAQVTIIPTLPAQNDGDDEFLRIASGGIDLSIRLSDGEIIANTPLVFGDTTFDVVYINGEIIITNETGGTFESDDLEGFLRLLAYQNVNQDNTNGPRTFEFQVTDSAGVTVAMSTITVDRVNDAPVSTVSTTSNGTVAEVGSGVSLSPILVVTPESAALTDALTEEDVLDRLANGETAADLGLISVSDLLAQLDIFDAEQSEFGIGIISANESQGRWQYLRTDVPGHEWTDFQLGDPDNTDTTPIPEGEALLIDADTVLRFIPNAGFAGGAEIAFRVWDGTNGAASNPPSTVADDSGGSAPSNTSSLSTAAFSINLAADTDGDGIINSVDVDDDNDGILDVNEALPSLFTSEFGGSFGSQTVEDGVRDLQNPVAGYTYVVDTVGEPAPLMDGAGEYAVISGETANQLHPSPGVFWNFTGNTNGNADDAYLAVNGSTAVGTFFSETITLPANLDYDFGVDTRSASPNNLYQIIMEVVDSSGTVVASIQTDTNGNNAWETLSGSFNTGAGGEFTLQVRNLSTANAGNDFALDNIFVRTAFGFTPQDSDGDGIFDHLDIDSDNDGITDNIEAQSTAGYVAPSGVGNGITDVNNDGLDDNYDSRNANGTGTLTATSAAATVEDGDGLIAVNTDNEDNVDYLDTDSDNDGIDDAAEAGHGAALIPNGTASDATTDADGDGLFDVFETALDGNANDGFVVNEGISPLDGTLSDAGGDASIGTATPLVNDLDYRDLNDGPVAQDDEDVVAANNSTAGNVFFNNNNSIDFDPDGDTIEVIIGGDVTALGTQITLASGAFLTINADGTYIYDTNGAFDSLLPGQTATDSFTYVITDPSGETATAMVTLTILGVNDAPIAVDDTLMGDEETLISINFFATNPTVADSDPDGDVFTVTRVASGSNVSMLSGLADGTGVTTAVAGSNGGIFTVASDGTATFDPNSEFDDLAVGETRVTEVVYQIDDGNGGTDTAVVTYTVTGVNDNIIPVIPGDPNTPADRTDFIPPQTGEDSETVSPLDLSTFFSDPDTSDTVSFTIDPADLPSGLTFDGTTISGTPDADASQGGVGGVYAIDVTVTDSNGDTFVTTVQYTITNPAPIAEDDANTASEDGTVSGNVIIGSDNDPDGDDLTVFEVDGDSANIGQPVAGSNGGLFTINTDGSYTFDANGEFEGLDVGETATTTITYQVSDGEGGFDIATVTITLEGANDAPIIIDPNDPANPPFDPNMIIPAQSGDDSSVLTDLDVSPFFSDVDGEDLTFSSPDIPSWMSIDPDTGVITGTPPADASQGGVNSDGEYVVTIVATDPDGEMVQTQVTYTISNPIPVVDSAVGPIAAVDAEVISIPTMFSDPDGDNLTYSVTGLPAGLMIDPITGEITGTIDNSASQGGSNSDGVYTITVTADDGEDGTVTDTFTLTVTNPAPDAVDDVYMAGEDTVFTGNVITASDSDPDGDTLIISEVDGIAGNVGTPIAGASGGLFTIDANGDISFDPNGEFEDLDVGETATTTITYQVSDGEGGFDTATVTMTIQGVNNDPVVTGTLTPQTGVDGAALLPFDASTAFDDVDGESLAFTSPDMPSWMSINPATGEITGTSPADASQGGLNSDGVYTVTVIGTDPDGEAVSTTVSYTFTNPAPVVDTVIGPQTAVDGETVTIPSMISDPDGDTLTYSATDLPAGLSIDPVTGEITGTLDNSASQGGPNNDGIHIITVIADDGEGGTITDVFVMTVTNPAPDAVDDTLTANEGTVLTGNVITGSDSDPDGDTLIISEVDGVAGNVGTPIAGANGGLFTIDANGDISFDPNGEFEDLDVGETATTTITYEVSDGEGGFDTATVTVTVQGANDAPAVTGTLTPQTGVDGAALLPFDASTAFDDVDGESLSYSSPDMPSWMSINPVTGEITGTPPADASQGGPNSDGVYTVTVVGTDPDGSPVSTTVTYTFTNPAPVVDTVIGPQAASDGETVSIPSMISDPDGDTLTYSATGLPAGLSIDPATGEITGELDSSASQGGPNGDGVYTITITADDGEGGSITDTFDLTITNPAPIAQDDVVTTSEDTPVITGSVFADNGSGADVDPDGDTITVSEVDGDPTVIGQAVAGDMGGLFTINADGFYTFETNGDFEDLDVGETATTTITYQISDGEGGFDTATLEIEVTGENDAPVLIDPNDPNPVIPAQTGDDSFALTAFDVSDYFVDPDGELNLYNIENAPSWMMIDNFTGVITGTPPADASQGGPNGDGVYPITIVVTDFDGAETRVVVDYVIANPAPTAMDDNLVAAEDGPGIAGNLISDDNGNGIDNDPDGDTLFVAEVNGNPADVGAPVAGSTGGLFTVNADGSYSFDPNGDFEDLDVGETRATTITYLVSDGEGGTDLATVTVTINGANDAPIVIDPATGLPPVAPNAIIPAQSGDDSANLMPLDVTPYFTDVDVETLSFSSPDMPVWMMIDPVTGEITGTPPADASQGGPNGDGVYDITIVATDPDGETVSTVVSYTIVNPPPIAETDIETTDEDTVLSDSVFSDNGNGADIDPDGDVLTVTEVNGMPITSGGVITLPSGALLTMNADGSYDYNPNGQFEDLGANQLLVDSFTYQISDGEGGFDTATVSIAVTGVNDAPILVDPTQPVAPVDPNYPVDPSDPRVPPLDPLNYIPAQSGIDDVTSTPLDLTPYFGDPDSLDSVTLSLDPAELPPGLTFDGTTISGTPDNSASQGGPNGDGIYSIAVIATDMSGATFTTYVTYDFTNPAPVVDTPIGPIAAEDAQTISIPLDFSDPDGDDLSYTASGLPSGLSIDPVTGEITGEIDNSASTGGPNGDGIYMVTVTADDGEGGTVTDTFELTVMNPAPSAADDMATATEDALVTGNVITGSDVDPDGDDLTVSEVNGDPALVGQPVAGDMGGLFTINPDGSYTFDPNGDFEGLDVGETATTTVTYQISDGEGGFDTATVEITVEGVNDAPVVVDPNNPGMPPADPTDIVPVQTGDDSADLTPLDMSPYFTDVDVEPLSFSSSNMPAWMMIDPVTGEITGTPPLDASQGGLNGDGVYEVTIIATDPDGTTVETVVTFEISNPAPVVDTPIGPIEVVDAETVSILSMISDPDGDDLSYTASGLPAGLSIDAVTGEITGEIDNSASTGGPNGDGVYTVTVTADDGEGGTVTDTFELTVTNPAPIAENDIYSTPEDTPLSVNLLDNDSDPDGDDLVIDSVALVDGTIVPVGVATDIPQGSLTVNADGSVLFEPRLDYFGPLTFGYTLSDGEGGIDVATVTIDVTPVNDAPIPVDPSQPVISGENPNVPTDPEDPRDLPFNPYNYIPVQTGNDGEPVDVLDLTPFFGDPDPMEVLTISLDPSELPSGLSFDPVTGVISGTPDANASLGGDPNNPRIYVIAVTATDPNGETFTTNLTYVVENPAPIASDDGPLDVAEDTATVLDLVGNDIDPDGDDIVITEIDGNPVTIGEPVTLPSGAILTLNPDGTMDYEPVENYNGIDSFTYTISDGEGGTDIAEVTLNVTPVNDAPVLVPLDEPVKVGEDAPLSTVLLPQSNTDGDLITPVDISPGFADIDDTVLTFTAQGLPPGLTLNPETGLIEGTLPTGASLEGPYTVTITATDSEGGFVSNDFLWTVDNLPPVIDPVTVPTPVIGENVTIDIGSLTNDQDGDVVIQYSADGLPVGLTINPDTGVISGVPTIAQADPYVIVITADDGQGGMTSTEISLQVNEDGFVGVIDTPAPSIFEGGVDPYEFLEDKPVELQRYFRERALESRDGHGRMFGDRDFKGGMVTNQIPGYEAGYLIVEAVAYEHNINVQMTTTLEALEDTQVQRWEVTLANGEALPSWAEYVPGADFMEITRPLDQETIELRIRALLDNGQTAITTTQINLNTGAVTELSQIITQAQTLGDQLALETQKLASGSADLLKALVS